MYNDPRPIMDWQAGPPETEGLYWINDAVNGVLFAMVVHIKEHPVDGLYYYIMGCEMGFPIEQITHTIHVRPPSAPSGFIPPIE